MHLITTPHTSQAILWFSHSISKHLFLLLRTKYTSIRFIPAQLFRVPLVWHFTLTSPFSNPCWGYHGITLSLWKFTIWWHIVLPSVCFLYPQIDCKLLESTIQSLSLSQSLSLDSCVLSIYNTDNTLNVYVTSFCSQDNPEKQVFLPYFWKWGLEKLSDLLKVVLLGNDKAGNQIQAVWLTISMLYCLPKKLCFSYILVN